MKSEKNCFEFFSHLPITCINPWEAYAFSVQIRDAANMLSCANFVRTAVTDRNEVSTKLGTFHFSEQSRQHEAHICHKILHIYIYLKGEY